jgi:quinolinate synthase
MVEKTELGSAIAGLKKAKNAVILAHNYQIEEVQLVADFLGDSLELSKKAAKLTQSIIVFAGVKFMAETAKILSPGKKVLLPRLDAGCPMADMITVADLREMKRQHPNAIVVTYVNSSVEIKAESDVCCTSSNAVQVVANISANEIVFVPDENLGNYVQKMVPDKQLFLFSGFCYVHMRFKKEEITEMRKHHPQAIVIVHPEVSPEVTAVADEILSTSGMLKYVSQSGQKEFVIATEQGLLERMKRENPDKIFYPCATPKICSNMKRTTLEDIYNALNEEKYEITVDQNIAEKARHALQKMLEFA